MEDLAAAGLDAEALVLEGDPADRLLAAAADLPADTLFIGACGNSQLDRVRLGRVSAALVNESPRVVEVVRVSGADRLPASVTTRRVARAIAERGEAAPPPPGPGSGSSARTTHPKEDTMRAFVMKKVGEVGFVDKPEIPSPGPEDAVVRTTRALVCTSDCHTVGGAIGERENLTIGHEAVGVVEAVGSAVTRVRPGDRVAVNAITPCWRCENCQRGFPSQCGGALGGLRFANTKDGVFAERFHVNAADANCCPIPDAVDDEAAVYACDMLSTGFAGAEFAAIPLGGTVVIVAQGPVGLMATAGSRLLGAGLVIAVEGVKDRQALARHFGADEVLDPGGNVVERVHELTGGRMADSAIECLGLSETLNTCLACVRPGGTVSNVGYHGHGEVVALSREAWAVGMGDHVIRSSLCPGGSERMSRLLRLIETGRVDPTPLTSHRFAFEDLGEAFEKMKTKEDGMIKPLIVFPD